MELRPLGLYIVLALVAVLLRIDRRRTGGDL